jgi:hypothetical protein
MAADQERADRIRALKQQRPDLTWRRIADYVGVAERSATDWQVKGGIEYANAQKLAKLFDVDVDYIWRGTPEEERAPSPFAGQDALADRLDAIEQALREARQERDQHARTIQRLLDDQGKRLKRQDRILKNIEASITAEKAAKTDAELARKRLLEAAEVASRLYEDAARRLAAEHDKQAK